MSEPQIDDILDDQRRRWEQGERVLVEAYLKRAPKLGSDPGVVLDLIYNEMVLRERAGEQPQQQEYAQRFPHLSAELALQFEVDSGLDWQAVTNAAPADDEADEEPVRDPLGGTPYPPLAGYAIAGVLGRGATGVVYKARQLDPDRSVAVKVVLGSVRRHGDALTQLRAEAAALAGLRHPHVCPMYEIGMDAGRLFISQERVEGNLAARQGSSVVGPLKAAQWIATLAQTMDDLHGLGIVHGSLTAANVLVNYNGDLKITDIGIARYADPKPRPDARAWNRRPPEQEGRPDAIAPPGDVYALGVILHGLLSGGQDSRPASLVRRDAGPPPLPPETPRDLETICMRCLHADPSRRYPNAATLADDLNSYLASKSIRARRTGFLETFVNSIGRWGTLGGDTVRTRELVHAAADERGRADRLEQTLDLTCRLMRTAKREIVLQFLAEAVSWLTGAELVTIFLLDRKRNDLCASITGADGLAELRLPLGVGILGAATTSEPIALDEPSLDPRFDPVADQRPGMATHNLLALPLIGANGTLGIVQAINKRGGIFDADDLAMLSTILPPATIAIERAGL